MMMMMRHLLCLSAGWMVLWSL
jgi:hypothetical protein